MIRTLALLLAATALAPAAQALAQAPFATVERTGTPSVTFSGAERNQPIMAGTRATVSGEGFRPNQRVVLHYGAQPIEGGALTADAEGKITGTIAVPAAAVAGNHPIVVVATEPYTALTADLKVSPNVPLQGQDAYEVQEALAVRGLYQSAYSPKAQALFVTSAIGRPPVRQSELLRVDPRTLAITHRVTPAAAPAGERGGEPGVFAVYGVGVDDAHDTVWVTNTRQNTAAVYRQSDLALVKQLPEGAVPHGRDVVVDQPLNKAYLSATGTPEIVVYDTETLEEARRISVRSRRWGGAFNVASLSLDPAAHRLYAVSLGDVAEVAVVDTRTDEVTNVFPVPGARGAIGVGHDPQTGRIFVASQGSDNLVVLDGNDGRVIADTLVGAGALNVVFDPATRRAYVANRGAGTITVTDVDGRIVANLGPVELANHVARGPDGTIFAVDKSGGPREAEADRLLRIRARR